MLLSDQDAYQAGRTEPADAIARGAVNKSTLISGILFIANDALPHYVVQYLWRTYHNHIAPCFRNCGSIIQCSCNSMVPLCSDHNILPLYSAVKLLSVFTNPGCVARE